MYECTSVMMDFLGLESLMFDLFAVVDRVCVSVLAGLDVGLMCISLCIGARLWAFDHLSDVL